MIWHPQDALLGVYVIFTYLHKILVDFNFSNLKGQPFGAIRQNWLLTVNNKIKNKKEEKHLIMVFPQKMKMKLWYFKLAIYIFVWPLVCRVYCIYTFSLSFIEFNYI